MATQKGGRPGPIELSDRFANFVRFLDERGGVYQRHRSVFAAEIGLSENKLRFLAKRAEELGILDTERTGHPMMGHGRFPNTYRLRISFERFMETREELHGKYVAKKARASADRRNTAQRGKRAVDRVVRDLPPVTVVPPLRELRFNGQAVDLDDPAIADVDAWQDFSDF